MRGRAKSRRWATLIGIVSLGIGSPALLPAGQVRIFQAQSAEAFLAGEADGVAVDADGVLALARAAEQIAEFDEPFALVLVRRGDGWAIGTGNEGRVLEVSADGEVSVLFDAPETEVFALWSDPDGALLVGTSPDGKVYRVEGGEAEVVFDPEETYIWALARDGEGALWVATGTPGRLYRLGPEGAPETIWDAGGDHVRCLLPLPGGDLLFGTAGDARILRWRKGELRTLHDSELNEVVDLVRAADGSVWAAVLSSEASFVDLSARPPAGSHEGESPSVTVTVEEGPLGAGSRPSGSRLPRSKLLRIAPSGASEEVWSSSDETIFALAADGDRLWVGTGLGGRLYLFLDTTPRVEKEVQAKQIVGLLAASGGPTLLTTNGAGLLRLADRRESRGTYTSAVLDALQVSRFGVLRWQGELPPGSDVAISVRTGFSAEPDATWSGWAELERSAREAALTRAEPGRFLQYRLELRGRNGVGPRISSVEVSYRQENGRPRVESLVALDPGQILVPAGFNPAEQLFEPASPNRDGIFVTLEPVQRDERLKTVWMKGWRTVKWEASDPNGDELRFRLEARPEGRPEGWLELAEDLDRGYFAFDATALPDGAYRFRVTATDAEANREPGEALVASRESEPVVLDHTPPELKSVRRSGSGLGVEVYDAASPLRTAEVSVDGGEWRPARVLDGLLDGRSEVIEVDEVPTGAKTILLRLIDAAFNVRTFDLTPEAGG